MMVAAPREREQRTASVFTWCPGEDSNFHRIAPTRPSSVRVYQFRHLGEHEEECTAALVEEKVKRV